MPTTTNYGWTTPTVGGSTGSWGTLLNAMAEAIDGDLFTVEGKADDGITDAAAAQATADAALPKAGGVMTGRIDAKTGTAARTNHAAASGTVTLDLSTANVFSIETGGNITIAFSNVPNVASTAVMVLILISAGGSHSVSWPAEVEWPGNNTPSQTASQVDVYALVTIDGGGTWRGVRVIRDAD